MTQSAHPETVAPTQDWSEQPAGTIDLPPRSFTGSNQKIDPSRRRAVHLKPDGTPADNDRVEIGPTDLAFAEWAEAGLTPPDMPALRAYRRDRLLAQIHAHDVAGLLMFDPLNIRYATDSTNMQLWITHNAARACLLLANGHMALWDFHGCEHLSAHLPLVNEVRHGASFFYFETGDQTDRAAAHFASEINDLLQSHVGGNRRLAVDKIELPGQRALAALGIELREGQPLTEHARAIKNANEVRAMRCAIHACERAMDEMRAVMRPGVTEVDLWAALNHGNHIRGGEWIETRILSSGPRTNPWFQEAGPRVIQDGDIVAFDTDMIGTYGYCCDISRTWKVGDATPNAEEKELYQVAAEHIAANTELLVPGRAFAEVTALSHRLPEPYRAQRYGVIAHGVGLCDEYPSIRYPEDQAECGYGGVIEPGMVLCVEAYVGAVGGPCGVKLEEQVLVTETGVEQLSKYPLEAAFLGD